MSARFRSWWEQIKQRRVAIGLVGVVLVVGIALIIAGYWFDWSGFNGYNQVTITHIISGPSAGTVTRTEAYQPGKALWDWLQLLIIPVVLAVGGYLFNYTTSRNERIATEQRTKAERKAAEERAQLERDIALFNRLEASLKEYFGKMSELLLHENLRHSDQDAEVRKMARVWTLTVLPPLDKDRKRSVVNFLYESGLIEKGKVIINLAGADLAKANLSDTNLSNADLSGANLTGANLKKANLTEANLKEVVLWGADLWSANLTGANLREASISLHYYAGNDPNNTDLAKANLTRADLTGADIRGARLTQADLTGANLTQADLTGTILSNANLTGANLKETVLSYTDLTGVKATEELLKKAKSLQGATMPDGSKHD